MCWGKKYQVVVSLVNTSGRRTSVFIRREVNIIVNAFYSMCNGLAFFATIMGGLISLGCIVLFCIIFVVGFGIVIVRCISGGSGQSRSTETTHIVGRLLL